MLKPIRKRLFTQRLVAEVMRAFLYGLCAGALLLLAARLFPLTPYIKQIALGLVLLALGGGAIWAYLQKPTDRMGAETADRHGLSERVKTALENQENDTLIARLQREDAEKRLQQALAKILESITLWQVGKKQVIVIAAVAVLWLPLILLANPMDNVLAERARQEQALDKVAEQITEMAQKTAENDKLNEQQKKQLADAYAQLQEDLK
ncbi:hypothetical protein MXD63_37305, partial [Frankia sp. Cpl3]|nr:hypothetical protein [Frankia sp. Cpl3]